MDVSGPLERESDANLSTGAKFFSPECQSWAEPLRGWSFLEGVGGKEGASISLNRCGGVERKRRKGRRETRAIWSIPEERCTQTPPLRSGRSLRLPLINMSKGQACSVKGRNLNPQESGDMCSIFGFNHKSNSAGYFIRRGDKNTDNGYQF